jgi:hypothetical protein
MEGNLTRARSSLFVTPSGSLSSIHSSSPLSRSTPSPPTNGQRFTALGLQSLKYRQLHTPNDSPMSSPGHARVQSENSISTPLRAAPISTRFPVRASSAAARYNRGGNETSELSPPLSHTPENPREDTGMRSGHSSSLSKNSPPHGSALQPLNEDGIVLEFEQGMDGSSSPFGEHGEHRGLTRSASTMQMRDLRDQMSDLKGRLSVLRDRTRDDTMKRRSLQSLRTPSPFTAAEQWYTSSKSYGDSPLSADGGVAQPPWKDQEREDAEASPRTVDIHELQQNAEYAESEVTSIYEDVTENQTHDEPINMEQPNGQEETFDTAGEEEVSADAEDDVTNDYNDEIVDRDEVDDYDSDASLYHDTVPLPISHEDREDAFDYEHFFLHSAMGTISQQRLARRGSGASFSSEDSVETTRGPAVPLGHFRSDSTDSISTIATFATAEEGHDSNYEDEEDHDSFAVQFINTPKLRTETPATEKRTTFGGIPEVAEDDQSAFGGDDSTCSTPTVQNNEDRNISKTHRSSTCSFDSIESTTTTRSFPLINKQKSISISDLSYRDSVSTSMSDPVSLAGETTGESPVSMLSREDQILVERLVASLGKCVLGLQEAGRASYEGRVWRRRLDAARRVLEGQEGAV